MIVRPVLRDSQTDNVPDKEEEEVEQKEEEKEETVVEEAVSEYYKVGDIIDGKDVGETGAWFEGKISKITKEVGRKVVAGKDGLTYYVKYDSYPDDDDSKCKIEDIRPRARITYKLDELEEGMKVMANYNVEKPDKRGGWYDAEITKVNKKAKTKRAVTAMVFAGAESFPVPDCDILFFDEVMRCEEPVKLSERDDDLEEELNTPVERKNPFKCDVCQDNGRRKCKDCGCSMCGTKDDPANTILCDECDSGFCLKCLKLKEMPEEEEWFCPDCKNDDDIVKKGEKMKASKKKAKMPSQTGKSKRDWGQGFATIGRTKECTKVPKDHMGPIPGIEVGMTYLMRIQCSEEGIHRPPVAGIAGTREKGCPSLVLSGGYEDDEDNGDEFTYTGAGGRDLSGNKRTADQSMDQQLNKTNAALASNCKCKFDDQNGGDAGDDWKKGKPIRVLRNYKGAKHSKYAPKEGNRYDGIYKLVKYWPQKGKSGFIVWRYLLRRDDPTPAPWTKKGKEKIEEEGYTLNYPDGYLEAQAEKEKEGKTPAKGKKRKIATNEEEEGDDDFIDDEDNGASPAIKKIKTVYKINKEWEDLMDADDANVNLWEQVKLKGVANKKELT